MEIEKRLVTSNIRFLVKKQDKKLGEVETEAGTRPGYLSKLEKDENSLPSLSFLANVAKILNCSIDSLLYIDYAAATGATIKITKFIEKLYKDTVEANLFWERDKLSELLSVGADEDGAYHPLFSAELEPIYEEFYGKYRSLFSNNANVVPCDSGYYVKLDNMNTFYLMSVEDKKQNQRWFETYIVDFDKKVHPLCSTIRPDSPLLPFLQKLYCSIESSFENPRVSPQIEKVIDDYLLDGELPF